MDRTARTAILNTHLEEYRVLRGELDASIQESERWLQFALSLSAAFVGGGLVATEKAKSAAPVLMLLGSFYLTFAAVMYMRGDIKRARVLKYFGARLEPSIQAAAEDLTVMGWHGFSRAESDALRKASGFGLSWLKWGYLGRTLVFFVLIVGSTGFLVTAFAQHLSHDFQSKSPSVRTIMWIGHFVAFWWLATAVVLAWKVRREPRSHGG
jgi:hypothetical protein